MTAFTRLPSSALRLTGPDRLDFVQGQMTANLKAAPTPGMVPACFLNVRGGQIEQFARVYRRAGRRVPAPRRPVGHRRAGPRCWPPA